MDSLSCTPSELRAILLSFPSSGNPQFPCNEVFPNIFLGDSNMAICKPLLKNFGITHVLNAAQGGDPFQVHTTQDFYRDAGIEFYGVEATDMETFKLDPYFEPAASFIKKCLQSGGKVLVHCYLGISRSATLVLAYLMIEEGMTVQEAIKTVRAKREIFPNRGFLEQLCNLNERLTQSRK